ncbi:MAG TPA: hypothetical protein VKA15_11750 [Isosphaeraceae bacterium]|nr:hypothetical protein [Isosphaeraceae bacterium]
MARRINAGSMVAALALLGTLLGAEHEARAGSSVGGSLTVGGGVIQHGDPAYTYQLEVFLTGTISPLYSTSFTLGPLVGVDSNSASSASILNQYMAPGVRWSTPPTITSDYTAPSYPSNPPDSALSYNQSGVTWTYTGTSFITSPVDTPLLLGIFQITTDPAYSYYLPTGYPSFLTTGVSFSWITNGGSNVAGTANGSLTLQQGGVLVPEPSTMIAPLCVIALLPVVWFVNRRVRRVPA